MTTFVKDEAWLAAQPKKQVVAKILIKSNKGNVLLVKPTYVNNWQMTGGGVEDGEDPKVALVREIAEELGINVSVQDFTILDTVYKQDKEALIVVYKYNELLAEDIVFKLPADEIADYKYVAVTDVKSMLAPHYKHFCEQHLN
jgi:8-oxo-dGTP diphosphatase